ncbi:hypothetical protein Cgig2_020036 [Carnegiea gigantea]|uniref:Uncharacterized protein n=1 Tax=Carnegiea gigantea TaxID=171969 RepID=A0A9Q1K2G7_9CARY|nr:hypothetical protein Cgig2_020036 [Carnegiea gigantea]
MVLRARACGRSRFWAIKQSSFLQRTKVNKENKEFKDLPPERAFGDFVICNLGPTGDNPQIGRRRWFRQQPLRLLETVPAFPPSNRDLIDYPSTDGSLIVPILFGERCNKVVWAGDESKEMKISMMKKVMTWNHNRLACKLQRRIATSNSKPRPLQSLSPPPLFLIDGKSSGGNFDSHDGHDRGGGGEQLVWQPVTIGWSDRYFMWDCERLFVEAYFSQVPTGAKMFQLRPSLIFFGD